MVNGKTMLPTRRRQYRRSHFLFSIPHLPKEPGLALAVLLLERLDLAGVLEREADLVEPVQQGVLRERVYVEFEALAARGGHRLAFEVNGQAVAFGARRLAEQLVHDLRVELDEQQAVLEAVV